MTVTINLEDLMKNVSNSTIDSMTIPLTEFETPTQAAKYYHEHLDSILAEYEECFKTDLQAYIAKQIAESSG
ncbi:hypothetical protein [Enterococcus sp. AZ109]|uniref:hypothetical protein n=1 Tax=Enterococcus sp. AZ109 TaxID=2774634 RepID=UPI003F27CDEC